MKKVLIIAFLLLGGTFLINVHAEEALAIPLFIIDERPIDKDPTKDPGLSMVIIQDGNILTLPATSVEYTLELRDENGMLIYSSYVPVGTTQIILPATLSGDFEIHLVTSTYYYIGYIYL